MRQLETRRTLGTSSIDEGGLTVNPGGTSIALRVDDNVDWGGAPYTGAVVSLKTADGQHEAGLRLLDDGTDTPVVDLRSSEGNDGSVSTLTLVHGGASLRATDASPADFGQLQVGPTGVDLGYPGGGAGFDPGGMTVLVGTKTSRLTETSLKVDGLYLLNSGNTEWQAQGNSGYVPIRASAFPVSSSRAVKQNVHELTFDALEAVTDAPAFRWQYKPDESGDDRYHVSPMAEDLPPEIVDRDGDDLAVDTRDLIGVLWAAVRQLTGEVAELRSQVASQ